MEELKIEVPEGYIIDEEKSSLKEGKIIFKKANSRSKTWKEFCDNNKYPEGEYYINDCPVEVRRHSGLPPLSRHNFHSKTFIPSEKLANAFIALMQLMTIRDKEYTHGWEPDWTDYNSRKYSIVIQWEGTAISHDCKYSQCLTFKTVEDAREFIENWKDLIEIAKPLL